MNLEQELAQINNLSVPELKAYITTYGNELQELRQEVVINTEAEGDKHTQDGWELSAYLHKCHVESDKERLERWAAWIVVTRHEVQNRPEVKGKGWKSEIQEPDAFVLDIGF